MVTLTGRTLRSVCIFVNFHKAATYGCLLTANEFGVDVFSHKFPLVQLADQYMLLAR